MSNVLPRSAAILRRPGDLAATWFEAMHHRIARWAPPGALYLAVGGFALLSMRQNSSVPGTSGLTLAQTIFAAGAALWAVTILSGHARLARDWAPIAAVLGYVTASFISYAVATSRGVLEVSQSAVDRYVLVDLLLAGLVMLILTVVTSQRALRVVLGGLVLGATVSGLFGLLYAATGLDIAGSFRIPVITRASDYLLVRDATRAGVNRPQGSAGHPLELGAVMTVLAPLAAALYFSARRRAAATSYLWLGCLAIIALAGLSTLSRSSIVGAVAALAIMCWRWPIQRFALIAVSVIAVVTIGVVAQLRLITGMISTFAGSATDSSIQSREVGRNYVIDNVAQYFWFGQGVGAYPTLDQPVLDNQYLSRLMEAGAIGLISFCMALAVALILALRASASADPALAELAGGLSGSVAALIVICLILDTAGFMQIWYLTWILLALSGVVFRLSRTEQTG